MPPISKPEQRFKAASGEQFTDSGRIRCHGLAKSKIRIWRETYEDNDTPTDELWPECQCGQTAEEGQYVCRFHGGKTPRTVNAPRTLLDVMPLDMAEKYRAIVASPDYISRKEDINLIQVRRNMLVEDLNKEADSEEIWGLVHEAVVKLRKGDALNALKYLEQATTSVDNKNDVWQEIYRVEKLLGDMTTVQMKTAKDLQSMATTEQVTALISTLLSIIISSAKTYIDDPVNRSQFSAHIATEFQRIIGATPKQVIDAKLAD